MIDRVLPGLFSSRVLLVLALLAAIAALAVGVPSDGSAAPILLGMAAAAPARELASWGRKIEPMKTFQNVGVNQTAFSNIPRYPRTILGFNLEKGGTSLLNSHITRLEMFLGETSIWGPVSATNLQMVESYVTKAKEDAFLPLDFTHPNVKEIGGEMIGGLDLSTLPEGPLRLEVDIAGATAPTLRGDVIWGPPQGDSDLARLMSKLIVRTYPQAAAGDFFPDVNVRGAILCRQFFRGAATPNVAVVTAHTAALAGVVNTGDGTFVAGGNIAVAALTPVGRYRAVCIEPAAAAGRFALFAPDYLGGGLLGTFTVAVAFTIPAWAGSLSGTLADATDFVAGDGFFIDVLPLNTNGNITAIEIKKNEDTWWQRSSRAARYQQLRYGRMPMAGVEVVDWLMDNHADGVLDTSDAKVLDYKLTATAAETLTLIHQVLAAPTARV